MVLRHVLQVLLLDEITVDLDVLGRADLMSFLRQECRERGATIIYVRGCGAGLAFPFSSRLPCSLPCPCRRACICMHACMHARRSLHAAWVQRRWAGAGWASQGLALALR